MRKSIAHDLWRIFGLECEAFTIAFDQGGVSIRIPFTSTVDLEGPQVITGAVKGANDYREFIVVDSFAPKDG